jgi:CheY-like chemotaxis protein
LKTTTTLPASFEIQQVIEQAYFTCKTLALEKKIEFYILGDLVSHVQVTGDKEKLHTLLTLIFQTTILNAKAKEVVLTIRQMLQTDNDILLEFCLQDNGQNSRTHSRGFGYFRALATSKQLIADLGGKAEYTSIPGINTTLKFVIRYSLPKQHEAAPDVCTIKLLKGKRVLVAEDNEINQKAIAKILEREGVIADCADNGKEAVDLLERNPNVYDLVIMDLQMPFMDGLQATNYIRKKLKSTIPIIAMSSGGVGLGQLDFELGISQYINKPFTADELVGELRNLLLTTHAASSAFIEVKIA